MDYQRIYDQLIARALKRDIEGDEYMELHHILPRCMGGSNAKNNLVLLTAREHFIAHQLLYMIHKTPKLANAWFNMLRVGKGQKRSWTSYQYSSAKKAFAETMKETMTGTNNRFYGKKHTEETKEKIRETKRKRGTAPKTQEQIDWFVENVAKKSKSKEHRAKISRPGFVMLKNVETGVTIRVAKNQIINYDTNIWKNPGAITQKREKCVYCGMESVAGNIKRWHNENCKHKSGR